MGPEIISEVNIYIYLKNKIQGVTHPGDQPHHQPGEAQQRSVPYGHIFPNIVYILYYLL